MPEPVNPETSPTQAIFAAQEQLQAFSDAARHARLDLEYREAQLKLDVLDRRDPDTKKPLYSNDTARDAALAIAKHTDPVYQDKLRIVITQERLKTIQAAQVDRLVNDFKLYRLDRELEIARVRAAAN